VHGGLHFPFKHLRSSAQKDTRLIGVIDWETELLRDRTHRVLVDHAEVGKIVARHLFERGHRRVLVLGTKTQIHFLESTGEAYRGDLQRGFVGACDELGLSWRSVDAQKWVEGVVALGDKRDDLMSLNAEELLPLLRGPNACTAVFGLLDVHAWAAQHMLAESSPELFERVEIIGQGDTPWSAFGEPPFSSVAWNIETVAHETALLIEDARNRRAASGAPIEVYVKPRLVVRGGPAA
jgi:DNA-binding LacI/PurR family transcriptional regulator